MKKMSARLLAWYDAHKRDLPWRADTDPYRVLVSELMLQQTQVKTVIPYYHKFLERFPDAAVLARAPEQEVLAAWAGLGYYRRARFLQAAARAVSQAGGFPRHAGGLRELPGVGAYTAAAVGSISFGLPLAVVDGNVIRVLSRLLALESDPTKGPGRRAVDEAAAGMLDQKRPGDFNQAVMELGALVCTPASPKCGACPLRAHCRALALNKVEEFPRLPKPQATTHLRKAVALVCRRGGAEVLMGQRGPKGRMQGFWHFPEAEVKLRAGMAEAAAAAAALALKDGAPPAPKGQAGRFRHSITRYRIAVEAFAFEAKKSAAPAPGWRWITPAELKKLPLASAERRLRGMLQPT